MRIDFAENSNIGPGKIGLLEAIDTRGSVSDAARSLQLSYRRAWLLLDSLNKTFDRPVTVNSVGGRGGGGARVTLFGRALIDTYRGLEREINIISGERFKSILPRVLRNGVAEGALKRTPLSRNRRMR